LSSTQLLCATCAGRETCQKKFSVSGKDIRRAEFVKDALIKEEQEEETEGKEKK